MGTAESCGSCRGWWFYCCCGLGVDKQKYVRRNFISIRLLTPKGFTHHADWHYDLTKSLQGLENVKAKHAVVLHDKEVHSFLTATYSFEHAEGKVGELCSSQFAVSSSALPSSAPVTVSEIRIEFEGSMKPIVLRHSANDQVSPKSRRGALLSKVSLGESTHGGRPALS